MKIVALSDLHGHLPEVPDCDLLLLAGDYCRNHRDYGWYAGPFYNWLATLRGRGIDVVGVGGNHDWPLHNDPAFARSLPWYYLLDETLLYFRQDANDEPPLVIYGSPWQNRFFDWAWNLDEPELAAKWSLIPNGLDVLLLHGPPRGFGDRTAEGVSAGSPSLTTRIIESRPKLVVFGHIHEGRGMYRCGESLLVNASFVDRQYRPCGQPVALELE